MVVNGLRLLAAHPIKDMQKSKVTDHGVTYGLGEAGYDIRVKQKIVFSRESYDGAWCTSLQWYENERKQGSYTEGKFTIASAVEEFDMPDTLMAIVHDKSSWARRGLSVFNTVIEPGWKGFLTLELVYHGSDYLEIPAGSGIAQVIFHEVSNPARYSGRYQNQEDRPVDAIHAPKES